MISLRFSWLDFGLWTLELFNWHNCYVWWWTGGYQYLIRNPQIHLPTHFKPTPEQTIFIFWMKTWLHQKAFTIQSDCHNFLKLHAVIIRTKWIYTLCTLWLITHLHFLHIFHLIHSHLLYIFHPIHTFLFPLQSENNLWCKILSKVAYHFHSN